MAANKMELKIDTDDIQRPMYVIITKPTRRLKNTVWRMKIVIHILEFLHRFASGYIEFSLKEECE